jgi:hypothetical protein
MAQDPFTKIMKDLAIIKWMLRANIVAVGVLLVKAFAFGKL